MLLLTGSILYSSLAPRMLEVNAPLLSSPPAAAPAHTGLWPKAMFKQIHYRSVVISWCYFAACSRGPTLVRFEEGQNCKENTKTVLKTFKYFFN